MDDEFYSAELDESYAEDTEEVDEDEEPSFEDFPEENEEEDLI